MVYRKRIQIFSELLNAAKEGNVPKTKLFYEIGTNHDYFKGLLKIAMRKDFISVNNNGSYSLDPKGKGFLEEWEEYRRLQQKAEQLASKAEQLADMAEDKKQKILKKYGLEKTL